MADTLGLVGTVDAIERVDFALPKIERAGAERIFGAAMHAVTASQRDHVLADLGFAIEDVPGWIPIRPFLLVVDGGQAGPAIAFLADADLVLHRLAALLHGIEKMIGRIDHDRARPLARHIAHKLLGRPVVNRLRRPRDAAGQRQARARDYYQRRTAIEAVNWCHETGAPEHAGCHKVSPRGGTKLCRASVPRRRRFGRTAKCLRSS